MRELISWLKEKHKTVLSCCGHGRYPMTLIVKEYAIFEDGDKGIVFREIFSNKVLKIIRDPLKEKYPRKFYKKDKQGYYFIPEVL